MSEIEQLRHEIADLRNDVAGLVEMWRTATGLLRFIKVVAGFGTAVAGLWALLGHTITNRIH